MSRYRSVVFAIAFLISSPLWAQDEARLLRFPATHDDRIVFTYAGNLYTVSAAGGVARRLTSHIGNEMFARFSPDGKWIAFTGQYDGNTEVYLIPSDGGVPKRLTYTATLNRDEVSDRMGPNNIVMCWKNDGKSIVFRSRMHEPDDFIGQLFEVSISGGLPRQLPLPRGGFCSFSPDDRQLAYNRVFREFRTWKRYRGGMADDIWLYDFASKKTENLTNNPAQDIFPMWSGNSIYFLSDRDDHQRMNLYALDLSSRQTRPLTHFSDFDIKFPSLGDKAIVFENGGYIYRFDLASQKQEKVPIRILEDQDSGRGGLVNVSKNITNFEISPDGKRALFGARGEIFTVPAQHGPTRNLTNTPGIHERNAVWSPDGKQIAYISDATGEDEIYTMPQDGSGSSKQITSGGDTYKYAIRWSPDGKKILWGDKKLRLQYVDIDTKTVTPVAQARAWEIRSYNWSPDGKWVAYAQPEVEDMEMVQLFSVDNKQSQPVTDPWHFSSEPVFSTDGKYLFFVSNRDFNPAFGDTEFNHIFQDMARIYLVTLAKDTESPLKPQSDEVGKEESDKAKEKEKEKDKDKSKDTSVKKSPASIRVDLDGIVDRVVALPISPGNYDNLQAVDHTLYYIRRGSKDAKPLLQMYDLEERKETALGQVNAFEIAQDRKKMLAARDHTYAIIDLPKGPGPVELKEPLNLSGMEMQLDRHQEWQQIFAECWRQMRDFFYDPTMHGQDWPAVRRKYEALVPYVNHRADLTYIIGEMIGELNAGHTYVGGGDLPQTHRIQTGLLGAQLERDDKTGYYKIVKILRGQNWNDALRSPLTEMGVNVREGEYLIRINGRPANELINPYEALVNTAGKQVTLTVSSTPQAQGSRDVVVVPIADEQRLYYFNWVEGNIRKVNEATNGRVGYIHIPDMLSSGLSEFAKYFYPQIRKKALIIDVRGNAGGNVSPMIIERLRRELALVGKARNAEPRYDPGALVNGPMVCLLNEFSASDGDLFPYRFQKAKLGKLIGKRSWGGVVGIRNSLPLVDGGQFFRPEFAVYDTEGKWAIEGHGVDPDIIVDNDPAKEFAGNDEQLNKAIEVILEELKTKEKSLPAVPPWPKK
jgi:tricorn protease